MLKLLPNKVAVIPISDPEKIGSIYVPDVAKERSDQGIVKYVGADVDPAIKVGSYVIFSGYSGTIIKLEAQDGSVAERVIILNEDSVFAIINDFERVDISGLYFRDKDGEYWTATYEMVMELIARALYESSNQLKVKTPYAQSYED